MVKFSNILLNGTLRQQQSMQLSFWSNFITKKTLDLELNMRMELFRILTDHYFLKLHIINEKMKDLEIVEGKKQCSLDKVLKNQFKDLNLKDHQCHKLVLCLKDSRGFEWLLKKHRKLEVQPKNSLNHTSTAWWKMLQVIMT